MSMHDDDETLMTLASALRSWSRCNSIATTAPAPSSRPRSVAIARKYTLHVCVPANRDTARCRSPAMLCQTGASLPITTNQNRYGTCYRTVLEHGKRPSPAPPPLPSARAAAKRRCFYRCPLRPPSSPRIATSKALTWRAAGKCALTVCCCAANCVPAASRTLWRAVNRRRRRDRACSRSSSSANVDGR